MAKAAKKHDEERVTLTPTVRDKEQADAILCAIGRIETAVLQVRAHEVENIRAAQERAAAAVAPLLEQRDALVKSLEKWAKQNKAELFKDAKTLELRFGFVGYRWSTWKIKFMVKAETVIERLREAGLGKLIRVKESVNRERILSLNYENDKLEPLGMAKSRAERFFYETKPAPPEAGS